jgi:hypothetical protein
VQLFLAAAAAAASVSAGLQEHHQLPLVWALPAVPGCSELVLLARQLPVLLLGCPVQQEPDVLLLVLQGLWQQQKPAAAAPALQRLPAVAVVAAWQRATAEARNVRVLLLQQPGVVLRPTACQAVALLASQLVHLTEAAAVYWGGAMHLL